METSIGGRYRIEPELEVKSCEKQYLRSSFFAVQIFTEALERRERIFISHAAKSRLFLMDNSNWNREVTSHLREGDFILLDFSRQAFPCSTSNDYGDKPYRPFAKLAIFNSQKASGFYNTVIIPVLNQLNLGGEAAAQLLLGTALQESNLIHRIQLGGGPGLGLYQMEASTHDDIWNNYLKFRPSLAKLVAAFLVSDDKLNNLRNNDLYATAMARIHYLRVPEPLPKSGKLNKQATY